MAATTILSRCFAASLLWQTLWAGVAHGSIVTYDFNLTWVQAAPDGFARPVIGINNQWPLPQITASLGDVVVVNVVNQLGNQSSSLHFHGLFMNGTSRMDGPSMVNQCAIPPGGSFTYNFTVAQPGTYWYHSHTSSQYPDGLRGVLVVYDPKSPLRASYDAELVITLSDWYHRQMPDIMTTYLSADNRMASDPRPDSYLLNDTQDLRVAIQPGKTYLVRMVNMGALKAQKFWIEGHNLTVVEVDGVYVQPLEASVVSLATGQRLAFLVKTKEQSEAGRNFGMAATLDDAANSHTPSTSPEAPKVSGWLVYDSAADLPAVPLFPATLPLDDMSLTPLDEEPLLENPDVQISLVVNMKRLSDGVMHWLFNQTSYTSPNLPSLFSALSGENSNPNITLPFVLPHNAIVEISISNKHMSGHPVHLHGHTFQAVHRSGISGGGMMMSHEAYTTGAVVATPRSPMRRDTFTVPGHGDATLRFRADNPGVWFFHCHMEWHAHSGLAMTFLEAPEVLRVEEPLALLAKEGESNLRECVPTGLWEGLLATNESESSGMSQEVDGEGQGENGESGRGRSSNLTVLESLIIGSLGVAMGILGFWFFKYGKKNIPRLGLPLRRHKRTYSLVSLTDKDEAAAFQRNEQFVIGDWDEVDNDDAYDRDDDEERETWNSSRREPRSGPYVKL
ncbi:hypothetical protein BP5796_09358 [Coleophoma crateriformis]|uniref:Uncharacterized protein n=1 Tax=Coleophoma crateriformis TaxID=565419 RepID=A0A3D8QXV2_9HELO|nr:hypothetical protein BP5796_09358 [Coleophoma crateriformis]